MWLIKVISPKAFSSFNSDIADTQLVLLELILSTCSPFVFLLFLSSNHTQCYLSKLRIIKAEAIGGEEYEWFFCDRQL